jgi:hypothetical protein
MTQNALAGGKNKEKKTTIRNKSVILFMLHLGFKSSLSNMRLSTAPYRLSLFATAGSIKSRRIIIQAKYFQIGVRFLLLRTSAADTVLSVPAGKTLFII